MFACVPDWVRDTLGLVSMGGVRCAVLLSLLVPCRQLVTPCLSLIEHLNPRGESLKS